MDGRSTQGCVYLGGRFVRPEEARVSALDPGLLHGDGVFETLRTYGGRPFRLPQHLRRLSRSAEAVALGALPDRLAEKVEETVARGALAEAYVRITCTRGEGEAVSLVISALPLRTWPPELYAHGAHVRFLWRRADDELPPRFVKSTSRQPAVLGRALARKKGADEGLFLDAAGRVAEGTATNVFAVRGKEVLTPPGSVCLPGVTRAAVLELAPKLGLSAREAELWPEELAAADEVFLTGTLAEVLPVTTVEDRAVGAGAPGPICGQVLQAYRALAREEAGR